MNNHENTNYGIDCVYTLEFEQVDLRKKQVWNEERKRKSFTTYSRYVWADDWRYRSYEGNGYDDFNGRFIRHGKGKEFWPNGNIRYDGEFLHDTACGKGKIYYEDGTLCYSGDLWLNRWHGKGSSYRKSGVLQCDGTFQEGIANGGGRYYFDSGILSYEGDIREGKPHGYGRKYNEDGTLYYEGTIHMGEADGKGRLYHSNGKLDYEGEVKKGKFEGRGRKYNWNGSLEYEGEFVDSEYCGQGRLYDPETGKLIREGLFPEESEPEEIVNIPGALRDFLKNKNDEPADPSAASLGLCFQDKGEKSLEEFLEEELEEDERGESES